jgi:hypothetical protein
MLMGSCSSANAESPPNANTSGRLPYTCGRVKGNFSVCIEGGLLSVPEGAEVHSYFEEEGRIINGCVLVKGEWHCILILKENVIPCDCGQDALDAE